MWISREDYERLVTEAAQCRSYKEATEKAEMRAVTAELALDDAIQSLAVERTRFEQERLHWANMAASELAAERERGIQERADHYKLIKAMTDRHYTVREKTYAVSTPLEPPPVNHPKGYTHDPTEIDLAKLEYYKECARRAGHDEEDALAKWEAEMRGEGLRIEESETEQ